MAINVIRDMVNAMKKAGLLEQTVSETEEGPKEKTTADDTEEGPNEEIAIDNTEERPNKEIATDDTEGLIPYHSLDNTKEPKKKGKPVKQHDGPHHSPAGVGSVGNIPGPSNTGEAVVGVLAPGIIATVLGALSGLGGGGGGGGFPIGAGPGGPYPSYGGEPPVYPGGRRSEDDYSVGTYPADAEAYRTL